MIRIDNTEFFHFLQHADILRRSGSLCDAIISVRSQTFKAHRLVLACASRRLAQQLAQGDADSPAHCTLEHFSPHTFQQVLDFIYTQALEVSVDDLHLLLRAAQLLEMQLLEDQCRKQLDTLKYKSRSEYIRREITDVKEEKESADEPEQKKNRPVQVEKPVVEESDSTAMENLSPSDPAKKHKKQSFLEKKPRLSPIPATTCSRDSVITRPDTSSSSFSSPWAFSSDMWKSVSTLRRIAENCSNFLGAHPVQSPDQSCVAYPFSLSSPNIFPLLSPHFQNPVHSSVVGYSGIYSCYPQNLYAAPPGMGSIIKQSLLKRKKPGISGTVQNHEPR